MQRNRTRRISFEVLEPRQMLSVTTQGDYNLNGYVDAADYVVWRKTLGSSVSTPASNADGSGNGQVDPNDHNVFRANFGHSLPAGPIPKIRGDYNLDNKVDAADLDVWRSTLGNVVVPHYSGADGDGNGRIDQADYDVVLANIGQSLPSLTPPKLAGDYNLDGQVDQSDFVLWRHAEGTLFVHPYSGADGNGDTKIDQADYDVVRANFGKTLPAEPPSNPPVIDSGEKPIPDFALSATVTAAASGDWSNPASWSTGNVPSATDAVVIPNNIQLTIRDTTAIADRIVVHGTLQFATDVDTRLRVSTLHIEDDGTLLVGTEQAPVTATAQIIIRDTPIDLNLDPQQYGTGLLVEGKIRIFGQEKTSFGRLAAEPLAGATKLTFAAPVRGWQAGDRLYLPDTRQLMYQWNDGPNYVPQSDFVTVTEVSADGLTVTIDRPLAFDHLGARDGDGVLTILPDAANLTRNISVASENPNGTRGHTMYTVRADVDVRYVEFDDLGRTTTDPLNSTTFNSDGTVNQIGTNQIGRYSLHFHHLDGPEQPQADGYQYTLIGNVSNGGTEIHDFKWGLAIHDSHYGLVQDNVIEGWAGAGVVLEAGNETGNVIDHNFVGRIWGDGRREDADPEVVGGLGFWLRGVNNAVRNNVVANAFSDTRAGGGGGYFLGNLITTSWNFDVPVSQGSQSSIRVDPFKQAILQFDNNEYYGTGGQALSIWFIGAFGAADSQFGDGTAVSWIRDFSAWHYSGGGVTTYPSEKLNFDGLTLLGDYFLFRDFPDYAAVAGYEIGDYTNADSIISRANIQNHKIGIDPSTMTIGLPQTFQDSYLRNAVNVEKRMLYLTGDPNDIKPSRIYFDNVIFATPTVSPRGRVWENIRMEYRAGSLNNTIQSDEVFVTNYNGVQRDNFRVFYNEQLAGVVVPQTSVPDFLVGSPVAGLTNEQNWELYGLAIAGSVAPDNAVSRVGIKGLVSPLP